MSKRSRFRAFKCRMGVHRTVISGLPPMPPDYNYGIDPRPDRWVIVTMCPDCGKILSWRYGDSLSEPRSKR